MNTLTTLGASHSERRSFAAPVEMRSDSQYFGGLGALYYDGTPATEAKLWEGMIERFYPGTFDEFLKSQDDCFCSFDHDIDALLARRSSGSLTIESVAKGLEYRAKYDASDPDHQRVFSKIKRGDVRGSSIIFRVLPEGDDFSMEKGAYIRHIRKAWLMDIGPTHKPVYDGTTAEPRSDRSEQRTVGTTAQRQELIARARQLLLLPPLEIELWTPRKGSN